MKLFSRQYKYKPDPVPNPESLSDSARTRLYNYLYEHFSREMASYSSMGRYRDQTPVLHKIASLVADHVLEIVYSPRDFFDDTNLEMILKPISEGKWYDVYDTLHLILGNTFSDFDLASPINTILREESAGFVWHQDCFVPMMTQDQASEIMNAKETSSNVARHLDEAQKLLSDKRSVDFRNSVKESISAVECACQIVSGDKKATLGKTLKSLKLHPALEESYKKLYGYTSDGDGIRHALSDDHSPVPRHVAQYMWISCSAFITLLFNSYSQGRDKN